MCYTGTKNDFVQFCIREWLVQKIAQKVLIMAVHIWAFEDLCTDIL